MSYSSRTTVLLPSVFVGARLDSFPQAPGAGAASAAVKAADSQLIQLPRFSYLPHAIKLSQGQLRQEFREESGFSPDRRTESTMPQQAMNDKALLAAYAAGGVGATAAFEQLVAEHGGMLHQVCLRILGRADLAEDAAQAAFLVLAQKAGSVRGDAGAFLQGVAVHVSLRAREADRARRAREQEAAAMNVQHPEPMNSPWERLGPHLDEAVANLPAGERATVTLHYLEGRPYSEVARRLAVPEGTVASRLNRAMERMRRFLLVRDVALSVATLASTLTAQAGDGACPAYLQAAAGKLAAAGTGSAALLGPAGISTHVSTLAKGEIQAMFWIKLKFAAVVFVAVGLGTLLPVTMQMAKAEDPPTKPDLAVDTPAPAAREAKAVMGLRLTLSPARPSVGDLALIRVKKPLADLPRMEGFSCRILKESPLELTVAIPQLAKVTLSKDNIESIRFAKEVVGGNQRMPSWVPDPERDNSFKLRWENVGKEALVLSRDRCCDLYDRVLLKGADGKRAAARLDNRARAAHPAAIATRLEAGKSDEEAFDPWHWLLKPEAPGAYSLSVEFEQKSPGNDNHRPDMGKEFWIGKVSSNEVIVSIPPTLGEKSAPARAAKDAQPR